MRLLFLILPFAVLLQACGLRCVSFQIRQQWFLTNGKVRHLRRRGGDQGHADRRNRDADEKLPQQHDPPPRVALAA